MTSRPWTVTDVSRRRVARAGDRRRAGQRGGAGRGRAAVGRRTAGAAAGSGTKLVPGYLNGLPLAAHLGAAPSGRTLTVGVELQRPDPAGETALYQQMYQPGSAEYHHFLTPAQFNQRFGVAPAQTAAVRQWLTGGGLIDSVRAPVTT